MSANAPTSILGVTQYCIQGDTIQTRRLAPTVGEASQTRKFQVSLLFVDHRIVSLDMPPLCKWPEVGGVPIVSGDGQCSDIVSNYLHRYEHRTVSRVRSRRYSNLCEIRWNPACLAPCVTFKQGANQTPLESRPAIHLLGVIARSQRVLAPPSIVQSNLCVGRITCLCMIAHFSVLPRQRGETVYQLSMKDPNLNKREVLPHSTCVAQTDRL